MNSLTLGFLYVCGFSWLFCEVCVSASNGSSMPLVLFVLGFIVMFSVLGCIRLSDKVVNVAGPIFSILIGLGIVAYGFGAFGISGLGAALRIIGGILMIALGGVAFLVGDKEENAH
tara:strand:+ start:225 stop:572 length:348 start_codon:yes stop_codon:yes gene_type:complete